MRILVTGSKGQLALSLAAQASDLHDVELMSLGRPVLDLEDPASVRAAIAAAAPDLIVNAAAYTAVDRAETDEARAFAVNRDGARAVATAAAALSAPLIHLSTDYVFDGTKPSPYIETDATSPLNVYGHSKREGEQAVLAAHPAALVLRTSWVFSPYGTNFVRTMLRLGAERDSLRIVSDQIRPKVPKLATIMDEAEPDVLAYMTFPKEHRAKLHSTNPIERLNGEIKRRTEVVGNFPNDDAIIRLVGAILLEQNDEWAVQRARYMTLETINQTSDDPLVSLPAVAS